jgi:hypothetical protein
MNKYNKSFLDQLKLGQRIEKNTEEIFSTRGWDCYSTWRRGYIPLSQGGSPKLDGYTLPDLGILRGSKGWLIDIKLKNDWVTSVNVGGEIGLNKSTYDDYLMVIKKTGIPILLMFVMDTKYNKGVYMIDISNTDIKPRVWDGTVGGKDIMHGQASVLFKRSDLDKLNIDINLFLKDN